MELQMILTALLATVIIVSTGAAVSSFYTLQRA